ncbi:MAG: glycoside hydrolase [Marinilabilia sp.]
MHKSTLFFGLFFGLVLSVWGQEKNESHLSIKINEEHQVMHSFGASDAWRCQFVGLNWPEAKKQQMAEWLFSQEMDNEGNPLGIGLSLWRFNIGAGSMEQGDSSGIVNPWRRGESFLSADGTYDWNKQKGQQWFLEKAHEYGVENTLAFPNSAPVHYTINGRAYAPDDRKRINIKEGKLDNYAEFLAKVCEYFEDRGLGFDYLSPFNEPQWEWNNPTQEGTPATNEDLYLLTHYLDHEFEQRNISTEMALGEAAEFDFLTKSADDHPLNSDQFETFLSPGSPLFIGNFSTVAPLFSGHSYFTTWPVDTLIRTRREVRRKKESVNPGMDFWQSEFCILEETDDIGSGHERDLGMPTALYVARVIHHDLTLANASSWQWWTAITQCRYKDGLIYLDNGNDGIPSQQHPDNEKLKYDGRFHSSKLMWALGNYSRFIRPGMVRIDVETAGRKSLSEQANDLMVSAYKNKDSREVVLVAINYSDDQHLLHIDNRDHFHSKAKTYVTSDDHDLAFSEKSIDDLTVAPGSIKTVILNY